MRSNIVQEFLFCQADQNGLGGHVRSGSDVRSQVPGMHQLINNLLAPADNVPVLCNFLRSPRNNFVQFTLSAL